MSEDNGDSLRIEYGAKATNGRAFGSVTVYYGDKLVHSGRGDLYAESFRQKFSKNVAKAIDNPAAAGTVEQLMIERLEELRAQANEAPPAADADGRPVIQVNNRPLRDITSDVMAAVRKANNPTPVLFTRSGSVVRIKTDEHGRHIIDVVNESSMRWRVARCCNCVRSTGEGRKDVSPPDDLIRDCLALPGTWRFPVLEAVTEIPVLRPDGSILDQPGYDAATRLLYAPDPKLVIPPIPQDPCMEDAAEAADKIREVLVDFPFVDEASRANAIGLIITLAIRAAINAIVPIGLIDAPTPGTGKGLLAEIVALLATGLAAAMMTAPKGEEEWKKVITAQLYAGSTIILIDNVEDPIGSSHLAAAITARVWIDRVLGRTEMITLPQRATWLATGNNITLAGDLPRRAYWIRLDAKLSRPWQGRSFQHPDLAKWVAAHRGELVAAILTMCRAWWVAGCPAASTPVIGGFEAWSKTVGGILAFAGVPGFLGNLAEMYEDNDLDSANWETFLTAWHDRFSDQPVTVANAAKAIFDTNSLKETLPDDLSESLVREPAKFKLRLGHALRKRIQRRFGVKGIYVDRAPDDSHAKVAQWMVTFAGDAGVCGDCSHSSRVNGNSRSTQNAHSYAGGLDYSPQLPASPATHFEEVGQ